MYNQIVDVYNQIFPLNQGFLDFIPTYLGGEGSSVLDLGCGPGDYVDTLSRQGYTVTGIDSSVEMIRRAREQKAGVFYPFSFAQLQELDDVFDCAYCIGNSLSYLPNDALEEFLAKLGQRLSTGAYFVLQVVNWDRFRLKSASDFPVKTLADGRTFHRRYESIDEERVIFHTELRDGEKLQAAWADALSPKYLHPMVEKLEAAGLEVIEKYGNYQKAPYSAQESPAMILVSQKVRK